MAAPQRDRARQILRQLDMGRAIYNDPAVKESLRLTSEQKTAVMEASKKNYETFRKLLLINPELKKIVEVEEASSVKRDELVMKILTDEQRAEWLKLTGKPIDAAVVRPAISPLRLPQLFFTD